MTRYNYIIADMGISVNCDLAMLGLHSFKYFETKEKCVPISIAIDISSHLSASVDDMVVVSTSYLSNIDADGTLLRADNRYAYEIVRRDTNRKATFDIITCAVVKIKKLHEAIKNQCKIKKENL